MAGMIAHVLGALFTCGAIALAAFGFATSNWLTVMVDRDNFEADISAVQNPTIKQALINVSATDPAFTSHVRGLYVTCYLLPDDDSITWPNRTTFKEGNCVGESGYELNRQPSTVGYGPAYDTRIQLMRCHYAFLLIGLFMIVLGGLGSAVGCCYIQVRLLQLAGCFNFGGAFFSAAGIAFFHGFIYLEMTQIDIQGFFFYYLSRPAIYRTLTNNWTLGVGYSYILMWLAVGVALVGGILYFIAASHIHTKHREEEKKKLANERVLTGARNPAYAAAEKAVEEEKSESDSDEEPDWENEVVEKEVVPVPEPVPVPYPVPVPVPAYPYPPDMYDQAPPPMMYDLPMYGGGGYDGPVIPAAIMPASSYPYFDYGMYNSQL